MKSFFYSVQTSKKLKKLTIAGSIGLEQTSLHAHYKTDAQIVTGNFPFYEIGSIPTDIDFVIESTNKIHLNTVISYEISKCVLSASYNLTKYSTLTFSIGVNY